jgi:KaiC/GvpD/RAD55 family RecA-like ATPase
MTPKSIREYLDAQTAATDLGDRIALAPDDGLDDELELRCMDEVDALEHDAPSVNGDDPEVVAEQRARFKQEDDNLHRQVVDILRRDGYEIHKRGGDDDGVDRDGDDGYTLAEVDWSEFWKKDLTARDYAIDPIAPRGRATTIVSPAKEGKSELALYCAVQRGRGLKTLAQPAGEPIEVLYVDHEMTETDLQERLTDMGIDETVDLSHLHYVIMPGVAKLDTEAGGKALLAYVDATGAVLVIIDTISKIVEGLEKDAETWNAYWKYTGQPLHARGVTVIALDHSGQSSTRARGSSAKQAIFDVTWEMKKQSNGTALKATLRRVSWVPDKAAFARKDDPLRYEANNPTLWPEGTEEAAARLDEAGVPINATFKKARTIISKAGINLQNVPLAAALKWRRIGVDAGERLSDQSRNADEEGGERLIP